MVGGPKPKKEDDIFEVEDDLRQDAPVLRVGTVTRRPWRGLSDSTVPEASGMTPDTCQDDRNEGGAEEFQEFSVLSPGSESSMTEEAIRAGQK